MRVVSVVGARPQFVKLAPISHAFSRRGIDHVIIHTGQHYDPLLSDVFFSDLAIPAPDIHLGIGSGSHGAQTGAMLAALDEALPSCAPDWVLTYGDTNSTLAAAICAVKLHYPLAHLEAGLRSFNRAMPEEHNRVLTDHASDLLLAPTKTAAQHLSAEGLGNRTVIVGDVMTDVLFETRELVKDQPSPLTGTLTVDEGYTVATIHRAENTDDRDRLSAILDSLGKVDHQVVLLVHPRLAAKCQAFGLDIAQGNLIPHSPLAYPDLIRSVMHAKYVITDSGGLQKEAFLLGVPCVTVRTETEWVETVDLGWNTLVEPGPELINATHQTMPPALPEIGPYGDGHAAKRVADVMQSLFDSSM